MSVPVPPVHCCQAILHKHPSVFPISGQHIPLEPVVVCNLWTERHRLHSTLSPVCSAWQGCCHICTAFPGLGWSLSCWHQVIYHPWYTGWESLPCPSLPNALAHEAALFNPLQQALVSPSYSFRDMRTSQWMSWALCGLGHIWESLLCP